MSIVIVGAGEVGRNLAMRLSSEGRDVVLVDRDEERLSTISESADVQTVPGNGSSPAVLRDAGIEGASMLVAVTDSDETNIVACLVARAYAPTDCKRIARIRDPAYSEDPRLLGEGLLGIDFHINPEVMTARKIFRLLQIPQATDAIHFAEGRVVVFAVKLPEDSPAVGRKLADLAELYPGRRLLAVAIGRQERIVIPRGDTVLEAGDALYTAALPGDVTDALNGLGIPAEPLRRVLIAGGGRIGMYLARAFEANGVATRLVDRRREVCNDLAERLEKTVVINGDPTDEALLAEENIGEMDAFVAADVDEERNILASLLARRMGAAKVIAVVSKPGYAPLVANIGVDVAISPRTVATSLILQFIRKGRVLQVSALAEERAEAIEFLAAEGSSVEGLPLHATKFPRGAIVAALVRGEEAIIPSGDDQILAGDRVIVFALKKAVPAVERALTAG